MQQSDASLYKDVRIIIDGMETVITARSARQLAAAACMQQHQLENSLRWHRFVEQFSDVISAMELRERALTDEPVRPALDAAKTVLHHEGML